MDHKLCKNCKGFCCDDVGLVGMSPNDLENSYHAWIGKRHENDLKMKDFAMCQKPKGLSVWYDIYLTYPMLVFSHQDYIHPDGDINAENDNHKVYHYSCKHHNKKTGCCDIYEIRPMMCRTFPDSGFCGYKKVKDKRVKAFRPKWFKIGMTYHDWYYGMHPDEKEDKPADECPTEVKTDEAE